MSVELHAILSHEEIYNMYNRPDSNVRNIPFTRRLKENKTLTKDKTRFFEMPKVTKRCHHISFAVLKSINENERTEYYYLRTALFS